jgi:hypothetical protein
MAMGQRIRPIAALAFDAGITIGPAVGDYP